MQKTVRKQKRRTSCRRFTLPAGRRDIAYLQSPRGVALPIHREPVYLQGNDGRLVISTACTGRAPQALPTGISVPEAALTGPEETGGAYPASCPGIRIGPDGYVRLVPVSEIPFVDFPGDDTDREEEEDAVSPRA